jgi:hypothetical protein
MDQRPPQPPEGKLIADAAEDLDLSIRAAAQRAGLSYGRWRQIVQGYQNVSPGVYAKVVGPARTVARMAQVVGVTPEQMESEGRRPDAAEVMRRNAAQPHAAPPATEPAPASRPLRVLQVDDERELASFIAEVDDELARRVPATDPDEIKAWGLEAVSFEDKKRFVAVLRMVRRRSGTEAKGRRTG